MVTGDVGDRFIGDDGEEYEIEIDPKTGKKTKKLVRYPATSQKCNSELSFDQGFILACGNIKLFVKLLGKSMWMMPKYKEVIAHV